MTDVDALGRSRLEQGYAVLQAGGDAEAVGPLEVAATRLAGSALESMANNQLARALMRLDEFDAAREPLSRALKSARTGIDRVNALGNLAVVEAQTSHHALAAARFRDVLGEIEELGLTNAPAVASIYENASGCAAACSNRATQLLDAGDLDEAVELTEAAVSLTRDEETMGKLLNNLGYGYLRQGRLTEAERTLREALSLAPEGSPSRARRLNGLGHVYLRYGAAARALPMFEEALAIQEEKSTLLEVGGTTRNVANAKLRVAGPAAALPLFRSALAILREADAPDRDIALALTDVGQTELECGDTSAARRCLEEAIGLHEASGHWSGETASAIHLLGRLHELASELAEARTRFQQSLEIRERIPGSTEASISLSALARIDRAEGDVDGAIRALERAVAIVEDGRARVAGAASRSGLFERMQPVYQELIGCLAARDAPGDAARALFCAESARGRGLLDAVFAPAPPRSDRERAARRALAEAHARYRSAQADPATPSEELEGLRARELALEEEAHRAAALDEGGLQAGFLPLSAKEIQAGLDPGTLLLEYDATGDETFVWGVRRDALVLKRLDSTEAELSKLVERLMAPLLLGDNSASTSPEQARAELGARLLAPLPASLWDGADRVLVVPDGALHYLPFELLPTPSDGAPLIDRLPVAYTHSFSTQMALRRRAESRVPDGLEFVGFANPPLAGAAAEFWAERGLAFEEIEQTEREVVAARELFGERGRAFCGREATEGRLREVVGGCRYVHLATHGLFDDSAPELSGLVLAPPLPAERAGARGDELDPFLQAFEIAELPLSADLVVCSACVTAMGHIQHGEGIVSLTHALLGAGASAVVASLWFVADSATADLMTAFYRSLNQGSTVSEALRHAKLTLRQSEEHSHPYYWAGFVATGDVI